MAPDELYDNFRLDVVDSEEPFLWTEDEVWSYMVDAQRMLYRLVGGVRDATSDLTVLDFTAGDEWVPEDDRILFVRGARLASTNRKVEVMSYEDLSEDGVGVGGRRWPVKLTDLGRSGDVRAIVRGMQDGQVRLMYTPTTDDQILLVVERMPLASPGPDVPFECSDEHHIHLLLWMKHLAYSKQDADTFDAEKAQDYYQRFIAYAGQVKAEKDRRNHKPRLISYGGL